MASILEVRIDSFSEEDMFLCLLKGDPKGETEIEVIAAQDQALQTKNSVTKILQTETDSKCSLCKQFDQTVEHNVPACAMLTKEQYINRHDRVCAELHFNVRKEMWMKRELQHWYDLVPKSVETNGEVKVTRLWNQQV